MINIYIFFSVVFLFILFIGRILQKISIPWIFSSLLLGLLLAIKNPFVYITESSTFIFLSNLGMYFLLFIIGFEIDLNKVKREGTFILKSTFFIVFIEAILGSLVIHYFFDYRWFISFIVALSFSTVGEAILIPILGEFKIISSKLGQMILSIGTIDDIFEVLTLMAVIALIGSGEHGGLHISLILISLFSLFILTFILSKLKKQGQRFKFSNIETLFLFVIAILFLFLGIGEYAEATALGAIMAGVGLKTFIPKERLSFIEKEIKAVCYGLFAPIFFLWAGVGIDIKFLMTYPLLILIVVLVSSGAKYLASLLIGHKKLGIKQSILLGTGLSVRFSTSIVIIKILLENDIIRNDLYSVIIASSIIFTFFVPILFSQLLRIYRKEIK